MAVATTNTHTKTILTRILCTQFCMHKHISCSVSSSSVSYARQIVATTMRMTSESIFTIIVLYFFFHFIFLFCVSCSVEESFCLFRWNETKNETREEEGEFVLRFWRRVSIFGCINFNYEQLHKTLQLFPHTHTHTYSSTFTLNRTSCRIRRIGVWRSRRWNLNGVCVWCVCLG